MPRFTARGHPISRRKRRTSRRVSRKRSTRRGISRSPSTKDTHHFKGIVNAGIISLVVETMAATESNSGVYVFRLDDLPIFERFQASFEFVRINKCRLEFMPRYNMTNLPLATQEPGSNNVTWPTFITGMDEVPLVGGVTTSDLVPAATWSSQGGDDMAITEMEAYQCVGTITPSYVRGLQSSKETEIYKKHSVTFTPHFFDYCLTNQPVSTSSTSVAQPNLGTFERKTRKWVNTTFIKQLTASTSAEEVSVGPDFYGPVYSFSNPPALSQDTSATQQLYDVKMHYSVSFRRVKGG